MIAANFKIKIVKKWFINSKVNNFFLRLFDYQQSYFFVCNFKDEEKIKIFDAPIADANSVLNNNGSGSSSDELLAPGKDGVCSDSPDCVSMESMVW